MELYEFPNEIPIATRWAGSACALILAVCGVAAARSSSREMERCRGERATGRGAKLWWFEFATAC
jgi:hypothetical protein